MVRVGRIRAKRVRVGWVRGISHGGKSEAKGGKRGES